MDNSRSESASVSLPRYRDLPAVPGRPPGSSWGLWGDDDQLGTVNLLSGSQVRRGLACATEGRVFPLGWDLEKPDPPFYGREPLVHEIKPIYDLGMDDMYNRFYPQASSQWDALCHVAHPEYGFYNNRRAEEFTGKEGTKNGIEHWARKGIVGRGILFDCERYFTDIGRDYDPAKTIDISVDDLEGMRESVGIEYEEGDILLLRTGWMSWYDNSSLETRRTIAEDSLNLVKSPGLAGGDDMAEYLWDSRFAAVASDTSALEAWPHPWEVGKYLHFSALALLGMPIGEMWFLDELAKDCATDGSWTFLLVSAPLNKLGGVGSPPNAIAIK